MTNATGNFGWRFPIGCRANSLRALLPSRERDHHFRGLYDRQNGHSDLQAKSLGRGPGDDRGQDLAVDRDLHFRHQPLDGETHDPSAKLVACAYFPGAGSSGREFCGVCSAVSSSREVVLDRGAVEEPPPSRSQRGKFAAARQRLHALHVQSEESRGFLGREKVTHAHNRKHDDARGQRCKAQSGNPGRRFGHHI